MDLKFCLITIAVAFLIANANGKFINSWKNFYYDDYGDPDDCRCINGECKENENGYAYCTCDTGYGLYNSRCIACNCGTDANCTFSGLFGQTKTCICAEGYKISKSWGTCKGDCSGTPCKNGGKCRIDGNDIECDCVPPFLGRYCEKDPCTDKPCHNGGTCSIVNNKAVCKCVEPFYGKFCDEGFLGTTARDKTSTAFPTTRTTTSVCTDDLCKNRGSCNIKDNKPVCICPKPFTGKYCEKDPCHSSPCLNGGTCFVTEDGYECQCKDLFARDNCENNSRMMFYFLGLVSLGMVFFITIIFCLFRINQNLKTISRRPYKQSALDRF